MLINIGSSKLLQAGIAGIKNIINPIRLAIVPLFINIFFTVSLISSRPRAIMPSPIIQSRTLNPTIKNELTKAPIKTAYGYHIIMRLPLSEKELTAAKNYWMSILAQNAAQEEINKIIKNAKVEHTTDYENYIKTIK